MPFSEAILQALQTAWSHKLRSFFTLLGIMVSVANSGKKETIDINKG